MGSVTGIEWCDATWNPLRGCSRVSAEDQATADERIPLLLETPAALRFLSAEPLLGPLNLPGKLDWVICGGESGRGARPMNPAWTRSLRDECAAAGVPFFMKQMGSVYGAHKGRELPDDLKIKQFQQVRAEVKA